MEIKIESLKINICPYCLGSGKLKVMQSVAVIGGGSVRGKDKKVKCSYCNGSGIKDIENLIEGLEEVLIEGLQSAT